jgi:hypothetical protein
MRALSGALAHLDRSESSGAQRPSEMSTNESDATTSSGAMTAARNVPNPPDPVPVDGGLGWLAAAGAAYAARRLQKRREDDD